MKKKGVVNYIYLLIRINYYAYNKLYNNLKTEEEKREFLGEIIFRKIEESDIIKENNISEKVVGKITGMILGLPSKKEIFEILEDENILNSRIDEALELIKLNSNKDNNNKETNE